MHETALVEGVFQIAAEQLKLNNLNRLISIKLLIGEQSGAVPEALSFAFQAMAEYYGHQGAALEIEEIAAEAECRFCGTVFRYGQIGMACPRCGGLAPKLVKGEELMVESIIAE